MLRVLVLSLVAVLATSTSFAQDRSGVRPEVLAAPSGPGSIEGLGESFEPNPNTGTTSFSVDIAVPAGVGGLQPDLGLHYSSGGGNGDVGLGWTLGLPCVQLGADRGLPTYSSADQIVLRGVGGGGAEDLVQLADGTYRFRIEGAFVRAARAADGSWRVQMRSGTTMRFGLDASARIFSGANVYAWMLSEQVDTHGNRIRYVWAPDATGKPYLDRVVYNESSSAATVEVTFTWEARPDALTSYLSTFAVTTARRLASVAVTRGGSLIHRYLLAYDMGAGMSRLETVRMVGRDDTTALPTLALSYAELQTSAMAVHTMASAPARSVGALNELDDVDGDGLPDLLLMDPSLDGGAYSYYPNLDGDSFGARAIMSNTPSVWLSSPDVQLADMNGDGSADVVARVSSAADGLRYYPGGAGASFGAVVTLTPNTAQGLSNADVRLVDLDHDQLTDWMRIDPTTGDVSVSFNNGDGSFTAATTLPPIDSSEVVSFSAGARFVDCNGDGLRDIALVRSQSFRCWLSRGRGRFTASMALANAPTLQPQELASIGARDVNGDSLVDLVHVGVSQVRVWLNQGGSALGSSPLTIAGTPSIGASTVVRVADMNGNGSADVVWIDPTNVAAPWRYLDVLSEGTPGLITRIENGLGKVTTMEYAGIGVMRGWARTQGVAWSHRSSMGQHMLSRLVTSDSLGSSNETRLYYADPFFDGASREFRGFAYAEVWNVGDTSQPTLVTEQHFELGEADEALKGLTSTQIRRTPSGFVFDRIDSTHTVRQLDTAADARPVRYAFRSQQDTSVFEGGPTPVVVRQAWDQDDYGNVVLDANYGRVSGADMAFGNDEILTRTTYATNLTKWILGRPVIERIEGIDGVRVGEARHYYDGPALVGLPLGQIDIGDEVRTETWIGGSTYLDEERAQYDQYGNVVVHLDARGSRREVSYDAASHTFVETERRQVDANESLEWTATYDPVTGSTTSTTEPSGETGYFAYDALSRLTALSDPGVPLATPTKTFSYHLAAPLSYIREEEHVTDSSSLVTIRHSDGLGRARGAAMRADAGRWEIDEAQSYGSRGLSSFTARAFFANSADVPADFDSRPGTHAEYDALGRPLRTIDVSGEERRMEYMPLVVRTFDEDDTDPTSTHFNTPTVVEKDGLGRIIAVVERDESRDVRTTYEYDVRGNLVRWVDANAHERTYQYDGRSRRTSVVDPNAGSWTITYTDGNDIATKTDPVGSRVRYTYDLVGRRLQEWHTAAGSSDEVLVSTLHYDHTSSAHREMRNVTGRLAWTEDAAGECFFGYDEAGRRTESIRRWSDGTEHASWFRYDAGGRVVERGYPDGTYLVQEYDERGLPRSLGPIVPSMEWTASSNLASMTYGNGVIESREYDDRLRLRSMLTKNAGGSVLRSVEYGYDARTMVVSLDDLRPGVNGTAADLSATYEYDDRYRLVREVTPRSDSSWSYDDVGNVLDVTSSGTAPLKPLHYEYPSTAVGPDRPSQINGEPFSYDLAGRVSSDASRTLRWDALGRLERVERGGVVEEYVYGYDGRRVEKRTTQAGQTHVVRYISEDAESRDGHLIRYVFVGTERVARLDSFSPVGASMADRGGSRTIAIGATITKSLSVGLLALALLLVLGAARVPSGRRIGLSVASLAFALASCGSCGDSDGGHRRAIDVVPDEAVFYVNDAQSTAVAVTNHAGVVVRESHVAPYGAPRYSSGDEDPHGFLGNEADSGSGLSDFHARPYRPDLGIFLAPDPMAVWQASELTERPLALAPYAYASGNPIGRVDRSGRYAPEMHIELIMGGIESRLRASLGDFYDRGAACIATAQHQIDRNQSTEVQYKHGMYGARLRDVIRMPGSLRAAREQLRTNAINLANEFVRSELTQAVEYLRRGGDSREMAMRHFGYALHTLTDSTSPSHDGFQRWNPNRHGRGVFRGGGIHVIREDGPPRLERRIRAEAASMWAFDLMMAAANDPSGDAMRALQSTDFFGSTGSSRGHLVLPARYEWEARLNHDAPRP